MPVFNLALDLGAGFVEDVEQMLGKLVFESHIVFAAVLVGQILPLLEPLIQSIGNENAVTHTGKSLLPSSVFCARETNVDGWRPNFGGVGKVLVELLVEVISVKIPEIVSRDTDLIGVALDLAEQEDVAVALTNRPLGGVLELFDDGQILRKKLVVEIVNGGRANDILARISVRGGDFFPSSALAIHSARADVLQTRTPTARPFSIMISFMVASTRTSPPNSLTMLVDRIDMF